ncbi:hypothetical protein LB503_007573 [Fusarium chuoi]|nr:hypothetical protein LB503_007573 [Fusarium chuoi]
MDITMQEEEEAAAAEAAAAAQAEEDFPGTEDAKKESLKEQEQKAEEKAAAAADHQAGPPPPPYAAASETKPASPAAPAAGLSADTPQRTDATSPAPSSSSRSRTQIPLRPALMDKSHEDLLDAEANKGELTEEELKHKEKKKGGLTKEQPYEKERAKIRQERVDTLARKLLDRLSVWTETDKGSDVTKAFQEKMRLEVENLKMESFGIDILHAIGQTYVSKASSLLRSQKFFGHTRQGDMEHHQQRY